MVELVWDAARTGTATAHTGASIEIGEHAAFSPDDLLALAVAGCLMRTFVALAEAEDCPILSYVASARTAPSCQAHALPAVVIHAYVVVPASADRTASLDLADRSVQESPIARLLASALTVTTSVRALDDARPAGPEGR